MKFDTPIFSGPVPVSENRFVHPKGYCIVRPALDVSVECTPTGGVTNVSCINEAVANDDTHISMKGTTFKTDVYKLEKINLPASAPLVNVCINARVKCYIDDGYIDVGFVIGETDYLVQIVNNEELNSFVSRSSLVTLNPATSQPWTVGDINDALFKIKMRMESGANYTSYCSQLYLAYTPLPYSTIHRSGDDVLVSNAAGAKKINLTVVE